MKITATIDKLCTNKDSSTLAYATVVFDGAVALHHVRIARSSTGLPIVLLPARIYTNQHGNQKHDPIAEPCTAWARGEINCTVLAAYNAASGRTSNIDYERSEPTMLERDYEQELAEKEQEIKRLEESLSECQAEIRRLHEVCRQQDVEQQHQTYSPAGRGR